MSWECNHPVGVDHHVEHTHDPGHWWISSHSLMEGGKQGKKGRHFGTVPASF